jgi:hypothetical protein
VHYAADAALRARLAALETKGGTPVA